MTSPNAQYLTLIYIDRFKIKDKDEGLTEPSGLALAPGGDGLWTISDDTKKIFRLNLEGDLEKNRSFRLPKKGLEGITIDPTGTYLFTVKEENNTIIKIEIATQKVVEQLPLAAMDGYDAIAPSFNNDGKANKGLEGIAWNGKTGTLFVMKEGKPGLLMEISADLRSICAYQMLDEYNGFRDPNVEPDFSGLCYDPHRDCFWVISDKAKRWFLYDWNANAVLQNDRLRYIKKGKVKDIEKAEGVAISSEGDRLYVVSDEEARLYIFEIYSDKNTLQNG